MLSLMNFTDWGVDLYTTRLWSWQYIGQHSHSYNFNPVRISQYIYMQFCPLNSPFQYSLILFKFFYHNLFSHLSLSFFIKVTFKVNWVSVIGFSHLPSSDVRCQTFFKPHLFLQFLTDCFQIWLEYSMHGPPYRMSSASCSIHFLIKIS